LKQRHHSETAALQATAGLQVTEGLQTIVASSNDNRDPSKSISIDGVIVDLFKWLHPSAVTSLRVSGNLLQQQYPSAAASFRDGMIQRRHDKRGQLPAIE